MRRRPLKHMCPSIDREDVVVTLSMQGSPTAWRASNCSSGTATQSPGGTGTRTARSRNRRRAQHQGRPRDEHKRRTVEDPSATSGNIISRCPWPTTPHAALGVRHDHVVAGTDRIFRTFPLAQASAAGQPTTRWVRGGVGQTPQATATESVYTVPTIADHPGEPCRGPGDTQDGCDQAWRWNLDRVVDPLGNLTTYRYYREWNKCAAVGGWAGDDLYVRAGRLGEINYGAHTTNPQPTARVTFGGQYRCNTLTGTGPRRARSPSRGRARPRTRTCRPTGAAPRAPAA